MLRAMLACFQRSPGLTFTPAQLAAELGLDAAVVEHMLATLVRSGRLLVVDEGDGCAACPLARVCVGGLAPGGRCYTLRCEV